METLCRPLPFSLESVKAIGGRFREGARKNASDRQNLLEQPSVIGIISVNTCHHAAPFWRGRFILRMMPEGRFIVWRLLALRPRLISKPKLPLGLFFGKSVRRV